MTMLAFPEIHAGVNNLRNHKALSKKITNISLNFRLIQKFIRENLNLASDPPKEGDLFPMKYCGIMRNISPQNHVMRAMALGVSGRT